MRLELGGLLVEFREKYVPRIARDLDQTGWFCESGSGACPEITFNLHRTGGDPLSGQPITGRAAVVAYQPPKAASYPAPARNTSASQ